MATSTPAVGALALIVTCFVGSATLRFTENGAAFAEGISSALANAQSAHPAPEPEKITTAEADRLLVAIRDRERQLDGEAEQLADRAQALSIAERKLEEQLVAFEMAQRQLEDTLALADKAAERDIDRMTAVYEAMKPADAARIFEQMEISFAAGLMARMRPELTANVLTSMEPETAYAVTLTIASRNSEVPTD